MKVVIFNPGTGPIEGASEEHAINNMPALLRDARVPGATFVRDAARDDGEGRYGFTVSFNGRSVSVEMPGRELERVRFTGASDQHIGHYPRLYVDGSSWVWLYAADMLRHDLTGQDDEC